MQKVEGRIWNQEMTKSNAVSRKRITNKEQSMKRLLRVFAIGAIALSQCNTSNPVSDTSKIGFTISTQASMYNDSLIIVQIYTPIILPRIPVVTVNGKPADSTINFASSWVFRGFKIGDTVSYRISLEDDTLDGQFSIPGRIDSVFCNGQYMQNQGRDAWVIPIDTATQLVFTWKSGNSGRYLAGYYGSAFMFGKWGIILSDKTITIRPDSNVDPHITSKYFYFSVSTYTGNSYVDGSPADNVSRRIAVYYDITGPEYQASYTYAD
jgi:hypothetical protein